MVGSLLFSLAVEVQAKLTSVSATRADAGGPDPPRDRNLSTWT